MISELFQERICLPPCLCAANDLAQLLREPIIIVLARVSACVPYLLGRIIHRADNLSTSYVPLTVMMTVVLPPEDGMDGFTYMAEVHCILVEEFIARGLIVVFTTQQLVDNIDEGVHFIEYRILFAVNSC